MGCAVESGGVVGVAVVGKGWWMWYFAEAEADTCDGSINCFSRGSEHVCMMESAVGVEW